MIAIDDDNGEDIGGWFAAYDAAIEDAAEQEAQDQRQENRRRKLVGKYIVCCKSPHNGKQLFYQDRSLSKDRFWTYFLSDAFGFLSLPVAHDYCKQLRYNKPQVMKVVRNKRTGTIEPVAVNSPCI